MLCQIQLRKNPFFWQVSSLRHRTLLHRYQGRHLKFPIKIKKILNNWQRYPQILADQLTLSQPREADYAYQIILAPPDFQTFRKALRYLLGGVKRMILDFIGASILHLQNKINWTLNGFCIKQIWKRKIFYIKWF